MAKGMMVTLRTLFRTPFTIKYPEEIRPVPVNARTNLLWFEERCTGCSTCAQACPDGCILVQTSPREDGSLNVDRYEIDFRLCMYCGLCVEACPYEAIQAGGPLNDATYDFDSLYRDKHRLTEMAQEHRTATTGCTPSVRRPRDRTRSRCTSACRWSATAPGNRGPIDWRRMFSGTGFSLSVLCQPEG